MTSESAPAAVTVDGPLTDSEKETVAEHAVGVVARRKRVIALLNAISNLHHGDLLSVLHLGKYVPMDEEGLGDDPALHLARTGEELNRIVEDRLETIYCFGECFLPMEGKDSHERNELGAWRFIDPEEYDDEDKAMH
jgi:hypothetical protein